MMKWITIKKFCADYGWTPKAVHQKRYSGKWLEGIHWRKDPDGGIMMNPAAVDAWIEGKAA